MRREYIYITMLIISIAIVIFGIFSLLNIGLQNKDIAKQNIDIKEIYENEESIPTVIQEKKVSPNSNFALKKYYDECNHFDYEEAELPIELVNLTKQEIEDYYSDWEVEEFTDNNLVLAKEVNGYCNQHFIIRLDDDIVNVYRIGNLGELNEYKKTDISKDYLPEEDVERLQSGIKVFGEGKLSSALEDFE